MRRLCTVNGNSRSSCKASMDCIKYRTWILWKNYCRRKLSRSENNLSGWRRGWPSALPPYARTIRFQFPPIDERRTRDLALETIKYWYTVYLVTPHNLVKMFRKPITTSWSSRILTKPNYPKRIERYDVEQILRHVGRELFSEIRFWPPLSWTDYFTIPRRSISKERATRIKEKRNLDIQTENGRSQRVRGYICRAAP